TETYEERYIRPLPNEGDIYIGSHWETGKTYILKYLTISNIVNLLALSTHYSYSNAITTRLNLKSYCDIDVSVNARVQSHLAGQSIEKLYKLIQEARRIIVMDNDLTDLNIKWIKALCKDKLFSIIHNTYQPQKDWAKKMSSLSFESWKSASLICYLRKDVQGIVRIFKTDFYELQIKEYHGKSDLMEKAQDFKLIPKPKDNMISLFQIIKVSSSIIKAKEIADVSDATIIDRETAEFLENKPKKTLEEMRSLDQYYIMDCYEILLL
ncbi:20570_t:CDS:2, partial [Funneliformis geosporum]